MVNNAVQIGTVISDVLNTTGTSSVEKLVSLNNNSYLNSFLFNRNYKTIADVVANRIEEKVEPEVNINVLKFYLHEIGLIFNINYSSLVEGAV